MTNLSLTQLIILLFECKISRQRKVMFSKLVLSIIKIDSHIFLIFFKNFIIFSLSLIVSRWSIRSIITNEQDSPILVIVVANTSTLVCWLIWFIENDNGGDVIYVKLDFSHRITVLLMRLIISILAKIHKILPQFKKLDFLPLNFQT